MINTEQVRAFVQIQIKQDILLWFMLVGLDVSSSLFISLIKFNDKHC